MRRAAPAPTGAAHTIGLVGAGAVVTDYHLPVLTTTPECRPVWVVDRDLARARQVAARFRIPLAAANVADCPPATAVLLATPVGQRREIFEELCQRPVRILCEKPFALNAADHHFFLACAQRNQRPVAAGYMRRFYASTQVARQLILSGVFGVVHAVQAGANGSVRGTGRGRDWYQASSQQSGGGILMETGCHLVDQVFYICGATAFELQACRQTQMDGLEYETSARARVVVGERTEIDLQLEVSGLRDLPNEIRLQCAHAEVRLGLAPDSPVQILTRAGEMVTSWDSPQALLPAVFAAFRAEWQGLLQQPGGADLAHTTGLLTTEFISACYATRAHGVAAPGSEGCLETLRS